VATFDPDAFLGGFAATRPTLCFYPSSGSELLWAVMELDADIFVFSDRGAQTSSRRQRFWHDVQQDFRGRGLNLQLYKATTSARVFQCAGKWAFLFFQDNNDALKRIVRAGHRVRQFVGIRDGCAEGGNDECIHEDPFLTKLLEASGDGLLYVTNHSSVLAERERSARLGHTSFRCTYRHDSRWVFSLLALLVTRTDRACPSQVSDLDVFCPRTRRRYGVITDTPSDAASLWKLAPFRISHGEGVIAQYEVRRLTA
jgi:hypothetical protein